MSRIDEIWYGWTGLVVQAVLWVVVVVCVVKFVIELWGAAS